MSNLPDSAAIGQLIGPHGLEEPFEPKQKILSLETLLSLQLWAEWLEGRDTPFADECRRRITLVLDMHEASLAVEGGVQ